MTTLRNELKSGISLVIRMLKQPTFLFAGAVVISNLAIAQNQSKLLNFDEDMRLVYYSDTNGNHIPDFSHAGYKNGEVELPEVHSVLTVSPVEGDNTAHIQAAIDKVSAMPLNQKWISWSPAA